LFIVYEYDICKIHLITLICFQKIILARGIVLDNVRAMRCPQGHVTFTEEQALNMEQRTEDIKKHAFGFVRSVSKSARSLVIRIPADLAKHLDITENSKIEMIPLGKKNFWLR